MQRQHIGYRIRGFYRVGGYALRSGMPNDKAQHRLKILLFWEKHGLKATLDAFGVSRRTLYRWKAARKAGNAQALTPKSSAPRRRRSRSWPMPVVEEIRRLRTLHPNLGKAKLAPLLKGFCVTWRLPCPSESTLGRLIADAPDHLRHTPSRLGPQGERRHVRSRPKARKPQGFIPQWPGHLIALDTVERLREGCRRYVLTLTDVHSRIGLAVGTRSHSARAARDFFGLVQHVFPTPITILLVWWIYSCELSDNGSEFEGAFADTLKAGGIVHWYTYPKTPKMNAHCERFNRTIQEEFVDYHEDLLFEDLCLFNDKLADWLLWFNRDRPHYSLGQRSPLQCLAEHQPECQRYWTHTRV